MDVIAVPIIFGFFVFWKVLKERKVGGWVRLTEMDLVTGREHNLAKTPASQLEFMVENISIFVEYPI
jgi:amino acid permease